MSTSPLLINEHPLMVLPSLATAIGLNQAIVLQQVHYWLDLNRKAKKDSHFRDGHWWTYNTFEAWQESNFPFWSVRTLKRVFKTLEDEGLLITRKFNRDDWNHTKWYTIDYEALNTLALSIVPSCHDQSCQVGTMQGDNVAPSSISTETINPETCSQTTTTERPKKKASSGSESECAPVDREALERAKGVAAHLADCEYWGDDGVQYSYRNNAALVKACHGHTEQTATKCMIAANEYMDGQHRKGAEVGSPQGILCKALRENWQPSALAEAKHERAMQERRKQMSQAEQADYTVEWLGLMQQAELILAVQINRLTFSYTFRYHDEETVYGSTLDALPPKYQHVTITQIREALKQRVAA